MWRWAVDWCGLRVVRYRYGSSQKFGLYDVDGDGFVDLRGAARGNGECKGCTVECSAVHRVLW